MFLFASKANEIWQVKQMKKKEMIKRNRILLATSWYSVCYISQLNLLRNIFIFAEQHLAARFIHTDSRNSFGLICLLGAFTNIHYPQIREQVLVLVVHHVHGVRVCIGELKRKLRQLRAFVRPPIIQSSTPLLSPSLAVAAVVPLCLLCWNILRGVAFASIWFIACIQCKTQTINIRSSLVRCRFVVCCVFSIFLFLFFCIVQISAPKRFGYGELRTHSYGNCGEWQGINWTHLLQRENGICYWLKYRKNCEIVH